MTITIYVVVTITIEITLFIVIFLFIFIYSYEILFDIKIFFKAYVSIKKLITNRQCKHGYNQADFPNSVNWRRKANCYFIIILITRKLRSGNTEKLTEKPK